jgi:predicted ester cyclase
MTTVDSNKIVARRYLEDFWNGDDPPVIAEIAVADVIGHPTPGETLQGRDILVQRHAGLRRIYGDPRFAVEDLIAEDDKVLLRWSFTGKHIGTIMGVEPAGKQITVGGMNLFQIADGKIVEFWVNADDLGELQQLGAVPTT